jgi:putative nucleotidyltransferase with HDIG domain
MVSRVLKLANSAYIGVSRTISSLKNAVVLLGQKRVRALAISSTLLASFQGGLAGSFSLNRFWRHSTVVGAIAESIAKHLRRYDAIDPEEVFSAAIMHDMGKLVLAGYDPERYSAAVAKSRKENVPFYLAEEQLFSHTRIGKFLADHWQFPRDIAYGILFHHEPMAADAFERLVAITHVADVMAHGVGFHGSDSEQSPAPDPEALASLPLPLERLKIIAEEAIRHEQGLESLVNSFS